jgi:hypothetical protein
MRPIRFKLKNESAVISEIKRKLNRIGFIANVSRTMFRRAIAMKAATPV